MTDWKERLASIQKNCKTEGWDGYGARPVTDDAVAAAARVCWSLDVVPTNHGGTQVDVGNEALSLEFDATGRLINVFLDFKELAEWINGDSRD